MKKNINNELRSTGCPIRSGMTGESGRSMVEMLGVLAVIGVLSVAGIAGYTIAMNKYRANELLNEASKRATIIAMQIASGKTGTSLSISEFGSNQVGGVTFAVDPNYQAGDKTFSLTLSNVDEDVCDQMTSASEGNTIMAVETGCAKITFNVDLSKGGTSANTGNPEPPAATCTTPCSDCQKCENGSCVADSSKNGNPCEGANEPGICHDGSCVPETSCTPLNSDTEWGLMDSEGYFSVSCCYARGGKVISNGYAVGSFTNGDYLYNGPLCCFDDDSNNWYVGTPSEYNPFSTVNGKAPLVVPIGDCIQYQTGNTLLNRCTDWITSGMGGPFLREEWASRCQNYYNNNGENLTVRSGYNSYTSMTVYCLCNGSSPFLPTSSDPWYQFSMDNVSECVDICAN